MSSSTFAAAISGRSAFCNFLGGVAPAEAVGLAVTIMVSVGIVSVGPLSAAEASLVLEMPQGRAIDAMNRWAGQPLPISATAWSDGELHVRLSGARAAVASAVQALGGERMDEARAAAFWRGLREHETGFDRDLPLWRLSVPSSTPSLELPGATLQIGRAHV